MFVVHIVQESTLRMERMATMLLRSVITTSEEKVPVGHF